MSKMAKDLAAPHKQTLQAIENIGSELKEVCSPHDTYALASLLLCVHWCATTVVLFGHSGLVLA